MNRLETNVPRTPTALFSSRRTLIRIVPALLALAISSSISSCTCNTTPPPRLPTAEATAAFTRAGEVQTASVVVDFEALRTSRLLPRERRSESFLSDTLITALPILAVQTEDETERAFYAHGAVATWLLREWDAWPKVLKMGVFLPRPTLAAPERMVMDAVLLLAVDADREHTREFVAGVAALDRAARVPRLHTSGTDVCLRSDSLFEPLCVREGEGWIALGTIAALDEVVSFSESSTRFSAPELPESAERSDFVEPSDSPPDLPTSSKVDAPLDSPLQNDTATARTAAADVPPILSARLAVPGFSQGHFTATHVSGLQLRARLEARDENEARGMELLLGATMDRLVENFESANALLEPAVVETRAALEGDAQAPVKLRELASNLSATRVLDRDGHLRSLTRGLELDRQGATLVASARIPDALARQVFTEAPTIAAITSLALSGGLLFPRLSELQCRARQAEVQNTLETAHRMLTAHRAQGDHLVPGFDDIGFEVEKGSRYTYCMGDECLLCTHPSCQAHTLNPCHGALLMAFAEEGEELVICAYGDANGDGDPESPDIWVIGDSGIPLNIADSCSPWR